MGEFFKGLLNSPVFWMMVIIAIIVAITAYYLQQQAYQILKIAASIEKSSKALETQSSGMNNMTESIHKQAHYLTAKSNILSEMSGTIGQQSNYLTKESDVLNQMANAIRTQAEYIQSEADEISRRDFGIEIVKVEPGFLEDYDSHAPTTDFAITISRLKGISKLKFLSETGHVLAGEHGKLQFDKRQLKGEKIVLASTEMGDHYLEPIATSICKLDRVGYFRYFYILAEYNQAFQLYLVAMKYNADGQRLYDNYRVFSKFDIYDLKYSEGDNLDVMLDNKMAEAYEKIMKQFAELN